MTRIPPPPPEFTTTLSELQVEFEADDVSRLAAFLELLYDANERMNLTRIPPEEAWVKHVADSLSLLPLIASAEAQVVVDVGSGGGVPAFPLALCHAGPEWHLIESTEKKARFLRETAQALGLDPITVHAARAEAAGGAGGPLRSRADIVTSRAVGRLAVLAGWCLPLVRPGGLLLAIKGAQAETEVGEAAATLRAHRATVIDLRRGPTGTVVVIEKAPR